MAPRQRSERTARLLGQRLEDLAGALERSGASSKSVGRLLELASLATVHAVQLDLLTTERAGRIWEGARQRHPVLEQLDRRLAELPAERAGAGAR